MLIATLTGNLGRDPEVKTAKSGKLFCNLSVACTVYRNREKQTVWVNVTVFDEKKIDFLQRYAFKGQPVTVQGEVEARGWLDQGGEPRASLEVTIGWQGYIEAQGRRDDGGRPAASGPTAGERRPPAQYGDDMDDEVPF